MAAKKQAEAAVRPTCDVVELEGYAVGRTTARSRIFLIWDDETGAVVGKFGLAKGEISIWVLGDIHQDTIESIAQDYYDQRDARKREAEKAKKAAKKKGGPTKTVARRETVQAEMVM